jgi:predicted esterase
MFLTLAGAAALHAEDYRITSGHPDTVDLSAVGLEPGDTVFIEAHTRQRLIIQNLTVGTPDHPIFITNSGGPFIIDTTTTDKGLHFYNCRHFILRGTPGEGYEYGIKIARVSQAGAIGLAFVQGTTDFEVSHLEISNVGFAGLMAKSDSLDRTQFTMRNVSIHHLYIHDTGGEGIYVGNSAYHNTTTNPHEIHGLKIHDNRIENTGWDGIQVGCATQDVAIYRNRIVGYGAADIDSPTHYQQNEGMRINPGTAGKIYDNWIEGGNPGAGSGLFANLYDDSVYYNNVIIASGEGESGLVIGGDFATKPGAKVQLLNNTIISPALHGIEFWSTTSVGNVAINNLIVNPGELGEFVHLEQGAANDLTWSSFRHYDEVADAGFRNPLTKDYRLTTASTAVDAGVSVAGEGVLKDADRVTRPFGAAYDIGAYEYYASPTGEPLIVAQLETQSVRVGTRDVTLEVIVAGDAPLTYAWTKDETPIPGATNNTLIFPMVALTDAGSYAVAISNTLGSTTSNTVTLEITTPPPVAPTITSHPASQTVMVGEDVTFSVSAYGTDPIAYQWKKDGTALPGETSPALTLAAVQTSAAASYTVTVSNAVGFVDSNAAVLTVNTPPEVPAVYSATTIVSDATVQAHVNATNTYTHAININTATTLTVNGLAFGFGTGNGGGAQPAKNYTVTTFNNAIANFNSTATGDIHAVLATRGTNTNSGSYNLTLSGLTAGQRYTFALLNDSAHGVGRNWYRISQTSDATTYDVDFSAGGVSTSRITTVTYTATSAAVTLTFTRLDGMASTNATSWIGFAAFVNYEAALPPEITTQPQSQFAAAGTNANLNVVATGAGPLSYQWYKNNAPLAGATTSTLTLYHAQSSDAGSYTVAVTGPSGTVMSLPAELTVGSTLYTVASLTSDASIVAHVNVSHVYTHAVDIAATAPVIVNGLTFSVGTGNGGGAQPALGYTLSTLNNTITNFNSNATGEIRPVLTSRSTNTNSALYTLTLNNLVAGRSYTFAMFNASGHGVGRNWYRVAQDIDTSTFDLDFSAGGVNSSRVFTITFAPTTAAATFTFTRLDGTASTNTSSWLGFAGFVNYELPAAPTIILGPKSLTVDAGATAYFGVSARGAESLSYQWFKDGNAINGATAATLVLPNAQLSNAGSYNVVVTNASGSVPSVAATLTVNPLVAPTITTQPLSGSVEAGASTSFFVTATGTMPLNYQWQKDGQPLAGATSATLTLNNVQPDQAGSYTVMVTNSVGSTTSDPTTLTVTIPPPVGPTITVHPTNRTVDINLTATFTVTATGTAPLSYQWFKEGVAIPGATTATLTLPVVQPAAAGSYAVTVTNVVDSATSNPATLTVNIPRQTAQRATAAGVYDFNYLQYLPIGYDDDPSADWPLVIFLHGMGERSTGETNPMDPVHLSKLRTLGPTLRVQQGTEFPFLLISPQCATDWWNGAQLEAFITEMERRYRVDRTRIYLTGLSMGGFGVYDLAQRNPSRYAAIAPISAAPQVDTSNSAAAPKLRDLPLWAFHGANDPLYSVPDLQAYLDLIRNVGGNPLVTIYTTPPGNVHDSWVPAYANDALYSWLLTHTAQPPTITAQPQSAGAPLGGTAAFTVGVSGRWPLTYQWTKNGAPLAGATTATLSLSNLQADDFGSYAVTVTNGVGTITSSPATLVEAGNLAYDQWAAAAGLPAEESGPEDDADGDGLDNLMEFATGTDPLAPNPGNQTISWMMIGSERYPTYTFVKRRALGAAQVVVTVSTNLNPAMDLGVVETSSAPLDDFLDTVTVRSQASLSAQPRQFFHLNVSQP